MGTASAHLAPRWGLLILAHHDRTLSPHRDVWALASLLRAFRAISKDVVAEIGSGDELSKKIYTSYERFRASITNWSDIAERAVLNSRSVT
jgi:hypothetical protein